MFTGIVQGVGEIVRTSPQGDGLRLWLDPRSLAIDDVSLGDSVAVNGCCLTVVASEAGRLAFDVSAETMRCTAGLGGPGSVNLEKALRLADRLGGHLVTGHVDGVGTVASFAPVAAAPGEPASWRLEIDAPRELARYIAAKGSIAVQGVSLTVNAVAGARFEVNLIPHTLQVTALGALTRGQAVNLEVDLMARYVARMLDVATDQTQPSGR
jgi:riboflavin synthase